MAEIRSRLMQSLFDFNKHVCHPTLTAFFRTVTVRLSELPAGLRCRAHVEHIYERAVALRVRGDGAAGALHGVALVGTRQPARCGVAMAGRLACGLAARGLVSFTGLARGVDAAGQRGAIGAEAKTV